MIRVTHWYTNFRAEAKTYKQALKKLDKMISEFCTDADLLHGDEMQMVLVEYSKIPFSNRIVPLKALDIIPKRMLTASLSIDSLNEIIIYLEKTRDNMIEEESYGTIPLTLACAGSGKCTVTSDNIYEQPLVADLM